MYLFVPLLFQKEKKKQTFKAIYNIHSRNMKKREKKNAAKTRQIEKTDQKENKGKKI